MNVQVLGASGRDKANLNLWRQSISFGHYTFIFGHRLSISNHAFVRSSTALVRGANLDAKDIVEFCLSRISGTNLRKSRGSTKLIFPDINER